MHSTESIKLTKFSKNSKAQPLHTYRKQFELTANKGQKVRRNVCPLAKKGQAFVGSKNAWLAIASIRQDSDLFPIFLHLDQLKHVCSE